MSRRPAVFQDGNIGDPLNFALAGHSNAINQRREEAAMESKDRKAALDYQKQKAEDDARNKTLEGIKGGGHVGLVAPDLHNDNEMYKLEQEARQLASMHVPDADLKAFILPRLKKINDGYVALNAMSEQAKLQSKELATRYGGDAQKAYDMIMRENQKDVFDFDESGNIKGYKGLIVPSGDHAANLTTVDKLPEWVGSSDALVKHVSGLPKDITTQNRIVRDKGFAHIDKNTEETNSLFDLEYDAKGNLVGKKVKVDENGAMPPEQFEIFKQNDQAFAQFARLYKPMKEAEMQRFKEFGVLGEEGLSPEADDLMQRRLAAKIAGAGISGLKSTSEIQDITPKPANVTNIKMGGDVPVRHLYANAKKLAEDAKKKGLDGTPFNEQHPEVKKVARQLAEEALGVTDIPDSNIYLKLDDNGTLWVMDATKPKVKGVLPNDAFLAPLPEDAVDLGANQTLGAPAKRKIQSEINKGDKPKSNNSKPKDPLGIL